MTSRPAISDKGKRAFDLLVACADWPRSENRNAGVREAVAVLDGQWDAIVPMAQRHRMIPLAVDGLLSAGIKPPTELIARAAKQRQNTHAATVEAVRLQTLLANHEIDSLVLKGPALSQQLYGDPAMRFSIDLDLLVDWDDFQQTQSLLRNEGYELVGPAPPWGKPLMGLWRKGAKDITLVDGSTGIRLELHHRLKNPALLLSSLGLATPRTSYRIGDFRFQSFREDDLFTYLVVHEATSLWHRLKWLADLRAMLSTRTAEEISQLRAHAIAAGAGRCPDLALLLCHDLWQQDVPGETLDCAKKDKPLASLFRHSKRLLLNEHWSGDEPTTDVTRSTFNLRKDWQYKQAFAVSAVLTPNFLARLPLPKPLWPFYLIARPLLWIADRFAR